MRVKTPHGEGEIHDIITKDGVHKVIVELDYQYLVEFDMSEVENAE